MSSLNLVQGNRTYTHSIQNDLSTSNVMINCDPRLKGPPDSVLDVKSRAGKIGVEDDICDLNVANLTVTNLTVRGKITVDKIPLNLLDGGTNYSDYLFYDTATNCFQIGSNQVHLGAQATAIGTDAVAIGFNSDARGSGSIAIGDSSSVNINSLNGIAIGSDSTSGGSGSIAIGDTAKADGNGSISIGKSSRAGGSSSVIIGDNTKIASNNCLILNSSGQATEDFEIPGFLVNGDFTVPLGSAPIVGNKIQFDNNNSPLFRSTNGDCGGGPGVPPSLTFLRFGANAGLNSAETTRTQPLLQQSLGAYDPGDKFIVSFEYKWLTPIDGPCPNGNPATWQLPPTPFFANPNMEDDWIPQLRIINGNNGNILARKLILDNPNSWTTEVLEYTIPDPAPPSIYFRFRKRGFYFQQNLVPPTTNTIWSVGNVQITKIKKEFEPNELVIKTQSSLTNECILNVPNPTTTVTQIQKPGNLDARFTHYLVCDPNTGEIRICAFP